MNNHSLIIIGASARAAAFSARRAGYSPYWLDQFGDEDLRQRFPGSRITDYPQQAVDLIEQASDAPFMYTGAMENHTEVLDELAERRTLLGNPRSVCLDVRDPFRLHDLFRHNGVPCPEVRAVPVADSSDWLVKPWRGAGGSGIRFHRGEEIGPGCYLQQYLPGESYSAVFVATRDGSRLLGVTLQLVGMPEFHAAEFGYCGSIGPVQLHAGERQQWEQVGAVLAGEFQLRGLFGVDAIRQEGRIYPVEVNPRYTASVETLELALDVRAVTLHCHACTQRPIELTARSTRRLIGKAVLFAPQDLVVREFRREGFSIADVPLPGTEIKQGHPVLTIRVTGTGVDGISRELKQAAECVVRGSSAGG